MDPDAQSQKPPAAPGMPGVPPPPGPPAPPVLIPDHELLRCIGRGSYGEVWLARNTMGQYRAIKIVFRRSFSDQKPFERELTGIRAFEPISRSHEGFVDVLQVGINEAQGYFYYVMELGDDCNSGQAINPLRYRPKTLAGEIARRKTLPVRDCLLLGLALSLALAALHRHKLVHRDVKPSNIIFVNGVPKLADIGLVAQAAEALSYVGTEGFIPPEGPGSPQGDVYGLGKVLYEACTGKDRQDFPELPTLLDRIPDQALFLELNEVILHACKSKASQRYPSAWDMHADLLVLANGKSVRRLRQLEYRLLRFKRVVSVLGLALLAAGLAGYQIWQVRQGIIETRQRRVGASVAYGNRAMDAGDLPGALPFFAEALRLDAGSAVREQTHRTRIGAVLAQCPKLSQLWTRHGGVEDARFSPDGRQVILCQFSEPMELLDLETGQPCGAPFGSLHVPQAVFSPDGRLIAAAGLDSPVSLWNASTHEELLSLRHPNRVVGVRFSPDGRSLVTACRDGIARIWDVQTGQLKQQLKQHAKGVLFAGFSPDGRLVVTTSLDNTAQLWNATNGNPVGPALEHGSWVTSAAFSPDGRRLATGSLDHKVCFWDVTTGRRIPPDLNHNDGVRSVEFSPDGRMLLTAGLDGSARLWQADSLQPIPLNSVLRQGERITGACFSPDGHHILSTCAEGLVRVWDLAGGALPLPTLHSRFSSDASRRFVLTNHVLLTFDTASDRPLGQPIRCDQSPERFDASRNGRFLLMVSTTLTNWLDGVRLLQVWDTTRGRPAGPELTWSNSLDKAVVSQNGQRLLTCNGAETRLWDVATGKPLSTPLEHPRPGIDACFSPDGRFLVTWNSSQVWVRDGNSGQMICPPLLHPRTVSHVAFSPDSRLLVTCCTDSQFTKCFAQVWEASSGQRMGPPLMHRDGVLCAAFSPDSRRVATGSEDSTAQIWDFASGRPLIPALPHPNQVMTVGFSPDGKWLVTSCANGSVRVWDTETGDALTPPLNHPGKTGDARFLPDGHRLVATTPSGQAWIWDLPADKRPLADLEALAQLLGSSFSSDSRAATPVQPHRAELIWDQLRHKYPSDFAASQEAQRLWDETQASESEEQHDWLAARFHLQRLQQSLPADPALCERLAKAQEHLADLQGH